MDAPHPPTPHPPHFPTKKEKQKGIHFTFQVLKINIIFCEYINHQKYLNVKHHNMSRCTYRVAHIYIYIYIFSRPVPQSVNTPRPRQNGHLFADDMFKCIFLNDI